MSQSSLTPEQVSYCEWLFGQWDTDRKGFDEMLISLNDRLFPVSFTESFTGENCHSVNVSQQSRQQMKNYLLQKILAFFPGEYNRRREP